MTHDPRQMTLDMEARLEKTSEAAFRRFHQENPQVYLALVRLARQALARGHHTLGIGQLFEVLRWELMLGTTDPHFKLNNNHRSRYARLIMAREPDLKDVFDTRELRS